MFNQWVAFHNPDLFENPETFDPERFIRSPYGTKPGVEERVNVDALKRMETIPFGFGRRRCVVMPMGVESAALAAANLFWAYEFGNLIDGDGDSIEPNLDALTKGLTNHPLPFKCKLKIRSNRHEEIIKQNYTHATPVFEQFERELSKEDRDYVERVRARL
ncbi:hypothetical protein FRC02_003204 [Tulasnella sp. 418]|nr:hypothetical protein FRC02_003204 [Tulasnella sp. 418]